MCDYGECDYDMPDNMYGGTLNPNPNPALTITLSLTRTLMLITMHDGERSSPHHLLIGQAHLNYPLAKAWPYLYPSHYSPSPTLTRWGVRGRDVRPRHVSGYVCAYAIRHAPAPGGISK